MYVLSGDSRSNSYSREKIFPTAILLPCRITFPFHTDIEQMSETMALFSFHDVSCPRFLFPSAQKKAFHQCYALSKGVATVYDGLR